MSQVQHKLLRTRRTVQVAAALLLNGYLPGFWRGEIYQGGLKQVCIPVLNCWSCPGALGSCPVGAIQGLANLRLVSLYVVGLVLSVGALAGRWVCGWLCPFGLLQELAYRRHRGDRRWSPAWVRGKYVALALLVPLALWLRPAGVTASYFCAYVCPAGTLQAGLPLLLVDRTLWTLAGPLLAWKTAVLVAFVAAATARYRPFCRAVCPLGAAYGLFNGVAVLRLRLDDQVCTRCGACAQVCPVGLALPAETNSPECVRCLACTRACPEQALRFGRCLLGPIAERGEA